MKDILQTILAPQAQLHHTPPREYKALLLACVDARKNVEAVGFGTDTLTLRNIAATAYDTQDTRPHSPEYNAGVADQRKAINDALGQGVQEFYIMNHDHCGGVNCLCGEHMENLQSVYEHLQQNGNPTGSENKAVGEEAVRMSVRHLKNHPGIRDNKQIKVHGLIINTATGALKELGDDQEFRSLSTASVEGDSETMKHIRELQKDKQWSYDNPPPHKPQMLLLSEMATPITSNMLDLHGKSLIYREHNPCGKQMTIGMQSGLDFARHMGVKHVALMIHADDPGHVRGSAQAEQLKQGLRKVRQYIDEKLPDWDVKLHPWLMDRSGFLYTLNRDGSIERVCDQINRPGFTVG